MKDQTIHIAGTYITVDEKILILQRHPSKPAGRLWGLPAGKMEERESPIECAIRETAEECGIQLLPEELKSLGALFLEKEGLTIVFHLFSANLCTPPDLRLQEDEVIAARWLSHEELLELPLIDRGGEVLEFCKLAVI